MSKTKLILILCFFAIFVCSCAGRKNTDSGATSPTPTKSDTTSSAYQTTSTAKCLVESHSTVSGVLICKDGKSSMYYFSSGSTDKSLLDKVKIGGEISVSYYITCGEEECARWWTAVK